MKYKTIRNLALIGVASILPYICDNGCAYSGNKTEAAEITSQTAREAKHQSSVIESLELKVR